MQLNLTSCFSALVLLVTLVACQDHRIPSPTAPRFRLKKEVKAYANGPTGQGNIETTTYSYNSDGKLASYGIVLQNFFDGINDTLTGVLTYDAQKRVIKLATKRVSGHRISYFITRQTYIYDTSGDATLVLRYSGQVYNNDRDTINFQLDTQQDFTYNGNNLPVKEVYKMTTSSYQSQYVYTPGGGNIVQVDFSSTDPAVVSSTTMISYDDKPNPYYGLLIDSRSASQLFSLNNALYTTDQLVYNPDGLLIQKKTTNPTNRNLNTDTSYEYEAY